jgi:uncharacterized membrane protein AbrB (regulator of aidB expression)
MARRRRVKSVAVKLSAVLSLVCAVVTVLSRYYWMNVRFTPHPRYTLVLAASGGGLSAIINVRQTSGAGLRVIDGDAISPRKLQRAPKWDWRFVAPHEAMLGPTKTLRAWETRVPLPVLAVALLLPVACVAVVRLTRRELPPNPCPSCNYDLSGLPPGAPCPECAAAPPAQP